MPGCEYCGYAFNLQRCSICKVALYCSRDHQKKHWTSHQKQCKRPALASGAVVNLDFNTQPQTQPQFKPQFEQVESQFKGVVKPLVEPENSQYERVNYQVQSQFENDYSHSKQVQSQFENDYYRFKQFESVKSQFKQVPTKFGTSNSHFKQVQSQFENGYSHNKQFVPGHFQFGGANLTQFEPVNFQFEDVNAQFEYSNSQFEHSNSQFEHSNSQFEHSKSQFEHSNSQFEHSNSQFEHVNRQFEPINSQYNNFEQDQLQFQQQGQQPQFRQHQPQFELDQPQFQPDQPRQFEPNQTPFEQEQPPPRYQQDQPPPAFRRDPAQFEPRYNVNDNYNDISASNPDDQLDLPEDFYTKLLNCSTVPGTEYENDLSVFNSLSKALGIYPTTVADPPEYESQEERGNSLPPFLLRRSVSSDQAEVMKVRCQYLIDDLDRYGICVMDDFLGTEWARAILNDVQSLYQEGNFKNGKVVKNLCGKPSAVIRGDKTLEVTGNENAAGNIKKFMQVVDEVVIRSCRFPNNGKIGTYDIRHRTKAMVAVYPGNDAKYVKHVDNPHKDGRCITSIYYLNENWNSKEDGGLLRIFPTEWNGNVADIEPLFDRMVFFWSDRRNPHEVQPSKKIRYAVTLWYYDYAERTAFERQQMQLNCAGSGAVGFNAAF